MTGGYLEAVEAAAFGKGASARPIEPPPFARDDEAGFIEVDVPIEPARENLPTIDRVAPAASEHREDQREHTEKNEAPVDQSEAVIARPPAKSDMKEVEPAPPSSRVERVERVEHTLEQHFVQLVEGRSAEPASQITSVSPEIPPPDVEVRQEREPRAAQPTEFPPQVTISERAEPPPHTGNDEVIPQIVLATPAAAPAAVAAELDFEQSLPQPVKIEIGQIDIRIEPLPSVQNRPLPQPARRTGAILLSDYLAARDRTS